MIMGQPPRGKMMSSEEKPKKIFISHRFADKPIADVINRNLARWGFDDIYQAGGPGLEIL
jgi:hypothetical protein